MQARSKYRSALPLHSAHVRNACLWIWMSGLFPIVSHFPLVTPWGNNIPTWTPTTQSTDQYILQYTICCIQIEGDLKRLTRNIWKSYEEYKYVLTGPLSYCRFYFDEPFRGRGKYSVFRVECGLRCAYSIMPYLPVSKVGFMFALRILLLEKYCCKTNREYRQFNNHINSATLLCKYYTDGVTK